MTRFCLAHAALAALVLLTGATGPSAAGSMLRIAYTTELRGNLLPCPCPTAPLGGLARRIGYIDSLRHSSEVPLLTLDGGSALPRPEDLSLVPEEDRPDLFALHAEAAQEAGYDQMLCVSGADEVDDLPWLSPNEAKRIEIASLQVVIVGVDERVDADAACGAVARLGDADLTILLCAGDYHFAARMAERVGADVAIVGRGARYDPPICNDETLLLGCGIDGKYVGSALLEITAAGRIEIREHQLRRMDGTVPYARVWGERVEELVLEIERKRPGALTAAE